MTNAAKKLNPTEAAVAELLNSWGIQYTVSYVGQRTRNGWEHDLWNVVFRSGGGGEEDFEYATGLGLRTPAPMPRDGGPRPSPGTLMHEQLERLRKPVAPAAAGPLYGLILDSSALYMSFDEWCGEYGYDSDSRKAEGIFGKCRENARKLRRVFTKEQLDALQEALQDY